MVACQRLVASSGTSGCGCNDFERAHSRSNVGRTCSRNAVVRAVLFRVVAKCRSFNAVVPLLVARHKEQHAVASIDHCVGSSARCAFLLLCHEVHVGHVMPNNPFERTARGQRERAASAPVYCAPAARAETWRAAAQRER